MKMNLMKCLPLSVLLLLLCGCEETAPREAAAEVHAAAMASEKGNKAG